MDNSGNSSRGSSRGSSSSSSSSSSRSISRRLSRRYASRFGTSSTARSIIGVNRIKMSSKTGTVETSTSRAAVAATEPTYQYRHGQQQQAGAATWVGDNKLDTDQYSRSSSRGSSSSSSSSNNNNKLQQQHG